MFALVTGGCGDFFCVESLLTQAEQQELTRVYLATRASKWIQEALALAYPGVEVKVLDGKETYYSLANVRRRFPFVPSSTVDLSIATIFPSARTFQGSSFATVGTAPSGLPARYYVMQTESKNGSKRRNFDTLDWITARNFLLKQNAEGVVIYHEPRPVPNGFINLTGLPLAGSIGVIQGSLGYLGIDSSMLCLAAKMGKTSHIKSSSKWFLQNLRRYLEPLTHYTVGERL